MTMAQNPPSVRAVAQVSVKPSGPWRLLRYRSRHLIGPFRVEQLVVAEAVLIAVLALLQRPLWQVVTGGVLGLLVLVAAFLGTGRRWWLGRVTLRSRYRRRLAAARPGQGGDQRLAVLRELSPVLTVDVAEQRGDRIGIGYDGLGWFAVAEVEVEARTGVLAGPGRPLPLGTLARTLLDEEFGVSVIQLVTHTVPSMATAPGTVAPCQQSYRELVGRTGTTAPVAHQVQWVVVRLDAEDAADASAARGGGMDGLHRAIAAALMRCGKAINGDGRSCRTLDADELLDALVRSCGVIGSGARPGARRTSELWNRWHGDGLAHVGYWVRDWPLVRSGSGGMLADLLAGSGVQNSASVVFRRPDRIAEAGEEPTVDLHCVVRVMAEPAALPAACAGFDAAASRAGFGLRSLDGEQAPAVYASAPTGVRATGRSA